MKRNYRDTITCNENLWITSDLWTAYDMIWERCSMLEGVLKELKACKMRFDAALEACKSYGMLNFPWKYCYQHYLFKVNNKNIRKRCETSSKLTITRTTSSIFTVNFEHIHYSINSFCPVML